MEQIQVIGHKNASVHMITDLLFNVRIEGIKKKQELMNELINTRKVNVEN